MVTYMWAVGSIQIHLLQKTRQTVQRLVEAQIVTIQIQLMHFSLNTIHPVFINGLDCKRERALVGKL